MQMSISELKKYYILQKDSKERYNQFLQKLSIQTTSREFFTVKNGLLEKKRKELHTQIINSYLQKYVSQIQPQAHFIIGSIGSGKTSLKDAIAKESKNDTFLYINFDDLKLKLPEYLLLKKLSPKKAAHFVQSESAKLAGTLYQKSIQNKMNIIYEKNLKLDRKGKLHLISEMKDALKKKYHIAIHVVFLDSYQEAWRRVQLRYDKIKRYVPKKYVKETFESLFPNLNILMNENFKSDYSVNLWYNGIWNTAFSVEKKAHTIGVISFQNKRVLNTPFKEEDFAILFESSNLNNSPYFGGLLRHTLSLPQSSIKILNNLDCLKTSLKYLANRKNR